MRKIYEFSNATAGLLTLRKPKCEVASNGKCFMFKKTILYLDNKMNSPGNIKKIQSRPIVIEYRSSLLTI